MPESGSGTCRKFHRWPFFANRSRLVDVGRNLRICLERMAMVQAGPASPYDQAASLRPASGRRICLGCSTIALWALEARMSSDFVARQRGILELLRIPPRIPHVWDETLNRRLLGEAAWRYQPDWLLGLDADERLEREFRQRALSEIVRARRRGFLAYSVMLRELWNAPDTYRADGMWGANVSRAFSRHDTTTSLTLDRCMRTGRRPTAVTMELFPNWIL